MRAPWEQWSAPFFPFWDGESGLGNSTLEGGGYGQPALLNGAELAQAITLRFTSDG